MFDVGMIIFAMLGLGLAMARKPSRTERVLVMACSLGLRGDGVRGRRRGLAPVAWPRTWRRRCSSLWWWTG